MKKKITIAIIVGIVLAILFIVVTHNVNGQSAENNVKPAKINDSAQKTDVETTVTAPEGAQAVENEKTYVDSSSAQNTQVKSQESPSPAAKQESGGHIPFTNAPVVAGQPETYVGTVGQCPFYEMAGEKGCMPPSDIECNADWSVCTKKGE